MDPEQEGKIPGKMSTVSFKSTPVAKIILRVWPSHPSLEVREPQSVRLYVEREKIEVHRSN